MQWSTMEMKGACHAFLTSDRPIIMTNGLAREDAHVVLPISPRRIFIATKSVLVKKKILAMGEKQIVRAVNEKMAEQAVKYVYGIDDSQLRFVSNRLGKHIPSTPLDTVKL